MPGRDKVPHYGFHRQLYTYSSYGFIILIWVEGNKFTQAHASVIGSLVLCILSTDLLSGPTSKVTLMKAVDELVWANSQCWGVEGSLLWAYRRHSSLMP